MELLLGDALGSVRQLTDENAEVVLAQTYEPYGEVLSSAGDGESSYAYAGEWTDMTGLQYLRARYMWSAVGRFLTRDTWAGDYNSPLSLNRWMYVQGNPVMFTDPNGNRPSINIPICLDGDQCIDGYSQPPIIYEPPPPYVSPLSANGENMLRLLRLYNCNSKWLEAAGIVHLSVEKFAGMMLQLEVHSLTDAAERKMFLEFVIEAAGHHLWADPTSDGMDDRHKYCGEDKNCIFGILNFLGDYVEAARDRYEASFLTPVYEQGDKYDQDGKKNELLWYLPKDMPSLYSSAMADATGLWGGFQYAQEIGESLVSLQDDYKNYYTNEPYQWSNRIGKKGGGQSCAEAIKSSSEWIKKYGETPGENPYIMKVGNAYVFTAFQGNLADKYCKFP